MISNLISLLVGAVIGALITYYREIFTERRKSADQRRREVEKFEAVCEQMPKLIAEMKGDLEQNPFVRDVMLIPRRTTAVNNPNGNFIYFEDEHDALIHKMRILENHEYVTDITAGPGRAPRFRFSESFVKLVRSATLEPAKQ